MAYDSSKGKDTTNPFGQVGFSRAYHERMEQLGLGPDGLDDLEVTLRGERTDEEVRRPHLGTVATAAEGGINAVPIARPEEDLPLS